MQQDITEWLLVIAYSALFLFLIRKSSFFRLKGVSGFWVESVFLMKVTAGILLGLLYTYHYTDKSTADTWKFFDDSGIIFNSLFSRPGDFIRMFSGIGAGSPELRHYYESMNAWLNTDILYNDNKTIIRMNVLFRFFSLGNYYVHVVFVNMLSFAGLTALFRAFTRAMHNKEKLLFTGVFMAPSVMFWGSGLLKDSIILAGLGILIYSFDKIINGEITLRRILLFLCALTILVFTKIYILGILLPLLPAWYFSVKNENKYPIVYFVASAIIFFIILFNIHYFLPEYKVSDILYWKQRNFHVLAELTSAKSLIEIPQLEPGLKSIFINAPMAFVNSLTRPFLHDTGGNPLILLSALETIMVLIFILVTAMFFKGKKLNDPLLIVAIGFSAGLLILSGLITPILGALVRYKAPAIPFLIFALLNFIDRNKIDSLFRRITPGQE
ncbi:MAG: hypothetical protein DWQ44_09555 [Bacteroidetes bacterium]|nr:MAG: hypothetical protein DWQ33_09830 [Bacteroidota bacterium]REK06529.1 MAG: hypothetical protein DWQ39_03345 [Bacteroidota bacterium]REK33295.1 MAG: hypothetical protein DWQ44_09555 [Bacteroidota bacterium]REK49695.1 MAG: hypothetical protein DWQ48_06110 [Bacteroidota bacterium]